MAKGIEKMDDKAVFKEVDSLLLVVRLDMEVRGKGVESYISYTQWVIASVRIRSVAAVTYNPEILVA